MGEDRGRGHRPDALGADEDDPSVGETTGDDTPATSEGIDLSAGDDADAVTDGGPKPPGTSRTSARAQCTSDGTRRSPASSKTHQSSPITGTDTL